jgi:hypothetical protein
MICSIKEKWFHPFKWIVNMEVIVNVHAIFVVVDKFSNLAKFALTQTNAIMVGTTKLFFDMWVQQNGMLEVILNDSDVKFTLKFWIILMKKVRTKLKLNIVFHL